MDKLMKGYQYLENDFFELCKTRKIHRIPMLLYIYLRGLYCRFQKPDFFWRDEAIRTHLGISQSTLQRARLYLQEHGLVKFRSGMGRIPTCYTLLATILLPRVVKMTTQSDTDRIRQTGQIDHSIYKSKERDKKKVGIDNANFHTLRNTFATEADYKGRDRLAVEMILGHRSEDYVTGRYLHANLDRMRNVIDSIDYTKG